MTPFGTLAAPARNALAGLVAVIGLLLFSTTVSAQPGARFSAGGSGRSHGAAYRAGAVPAFRSAAPHAAAPASPVPGAAWPGQGNMGFDATGFGGGGYGLPCQIWPYGPGLSVNMFYNAAMPVYGYACSSASWTLVPPAGFGWAAGWNPGFCPWLAPPAMMRNSDGALFFPPIYDPYGCWNGFGAWNGYGLWSGYGPWPGADVLYGIPGAIPGHGVVNPLWPGHGFMSSATGLSVLLDQPLIHPGAVPFAFAADPQRHDNNNALPPGLRVAPPLPGGAPQTDADRQAAGRPQVPDVPPPPEFEQQEHDGPAADSEALDSEDDEFPAIEVDEKPSSMSSRLRSLRHQATGDDSFRDRDYQAARESYQAALTEAGERRAPWLRMAIVLIAQQEFDQAAAYLKTGLRLKGDRTRAWITAEELYGAEMREETREHGLALWEWVDQRPLSTDRLLLAGAFQLLRGDKRTAAELLSLASRSGQATDLTLALQEVTSGVAQNAPADKSVPAQRRATEDRDPALRRAAKDRRAAAADSTSRQRDGIFLRGRRAEPSPRDTAPEKPSQSGTPDDLSLPQAGAEPETVPE